jgi:hypothetical protein
MGKFFSFNLLPRHTCAYFNKSFITSTSIVIVVGLQGPWNNKGCNMNVLPSGIVSVGVPSVVPHALSHAFRKAFIMSKKQFKIMLDLRNVITYKKYSICIIIIS